MLPPLAVTTLSSDSQLQFWATPKLKYPESNESGVAATPLIIGQGVESDLIPNARDFPSTNDHQKYL
jgi:hypothetical protein